MPRLAIGAAGRNPLFHVLASPTNNPPRRTASAPEACQRCQVARLTQQSAAAWRALSNSGSMASAFAAWPLVGAVASASAWRLSSRTLHLISFARRLGPSIPQSVLDFARQHGHG